MRIVKQLSILALLFCAHSLGLAQSSDSISFYDKNWESTNKLGKTAFIRNVQTINDSCHTVKVYNKKGRLLMQGQFSSLVPLIPNGSFEFHQFSGTYTISKGQYRNGQISGKWERHNGDTKRIINYDTITSDIPCKGTAPTDVFISYDKYPIFRDGDPTIFFREYINEEMFYPPFERLFSTSGRVIVQFEINENGQLCNSRIVSSINTNLNKEAIRILEMSPLWQGCKGRCESFTFPVNFQIE